MSQSERVFVCDPGERTGWCSATIWEDGTIQDVKQGVNTIKELAIGLYEAAVHKGKYDTLVYEVWRLYPHMARKMTGNDFQPSQFIGMVRMIGWISGCRVISQGANRKEFGKKVAPEAISRHMQSSSEQHDWDALVHLSAYWWDNYGKKTWNYETRAGEQ